jgi:uncharacterized membrane protein
VSVSGLNPWLQPAEEITGSRDKVHATREQSPKSPIGTQLMKFLKFAGKCIFASLFVFVGVEHFVSPDYFVKIMPPYLPFHRELVLLSGFFEIALGVLLLVPQTTRWAAWGLIALLIAVFPANIYMYQHRELFQIPPLVLLLRLPLQVLLIAWAWVYARNENRRSEKAPGLADDALGETA